MLPCIQTMDNQLENIMKMTRLFQLKPMTATHEDGIELVYVRKEKKWFPVGSHSSDPNQLFIKGRGWIDMSKWKNVKRAYVKPLQMITAKALKEVKDAYGYEAAMGMVKGWGGSCLFHDGSFGLDYAKLECSNACDLGEAYDKFTDVIQDIGDKFIAALLENGFYMTGSWLYYGDEAKKDTDGFGSLIGQTGIYEKIKLHPLQHIDSCVGKYSFMGRMLPIWNPIDFEQMLFPLFYAKHNMRDEKNFETFTERRDNMSVSDQIADLTNDEVAKSFEGIFAAQEKFIKIVDKAA